ncbi:MAG: transposase [Planctomycetota bacterium]|nr:transposase [Planctomycetota bacterium]
MTFNLAAPPGFRGLDPHLPVRIYTRNLPHWRQADATYFVTFNLADALPANKKNELAAMRREWEHRYPEPRDEATWTAYAKAVFQKVEKWMDAGHGNCWFRQPDYAAELERAILCFHEQRYDIGCFTIMGNHCHLVMRPFEPHELEDEVGMMKQVTARFVNKRESASGELWQQEAYDRIVRDEEHLFRVVQYIGANPRRAGLPRESWRRWINPAWQSAGWEFHDDE